MSTATITTSPKELSSRAHEETGGWSALFLMVVVAGFAFFLRLGQFGVIDGAESYYPAAVREMVEAGSYLVPQMNYQVYFSKPIMTFWLLASGYHLFGVNEFAGRFFGALLGVALTLAIYGVTRAIKGTKTGLLAGLLFAGSPFVLEYFRVSAVDAYFTAFLGLAFCSLLMVVSAGRLRWWPAVYISLGLAVLTKGPAAVVLFLAGSVLSLALLRPSWSTIRYWLSKMHLVKGTLALLAVATPWYVAVGIATKWLFLKVFFFYENLGRFNGHTNLRAWYWWRYIVVVLAGLLPWSLLLPASLAETVKRAVIGGREQSKAVLPDTADGSKSAPLLDAKMIGVGWALAVIFMFSISKTQMEPYILPAVAPLAIAAALYVEKWRGETSGFGRWTLEKGGAACAILGPLLAVALSFAAMFDRDSEIPVWARLAIPGTAWVLAVVCIYQRKIDKEARTLKGAVALALSSAILFATVVAGGIETWYNLKFADLHELCRELRATKGEIGLFNNYRPSVFYYVRRPVNCFFQSHWLHKAEGADNYVYILSRASDVSRLQTESGVALKIVSRRGEWGIYRADNAHLEPYATLWQTFSTLSVSDMVTDRYHLGVLTDCLSGGPLWKEK